jgi:hypothetical protein
LQIGFPISFAAIAATVVYTVMMRWEAMEKGEQWTVLLLVGCGLILLLNIGYMIAYLVGGGHGQSFDSYKKRVYRQYAQKQIRGLEVVARGHKGWPIVGSAILQLTSAEQQALVKAQPEPSAPVPVPVPCAFAEYSAAEAAEAMGQI